MKKLCVISGTRADYGLLFWLMKKIQADSSLELQTIATCMHLDPKFGETWKLFKEDGFPISKKLDLGELEDSTESIVSQVSVGVKKFFKAYTELKPDLIIILGDRYEMLAAAQAAFFSNIPIAHIHGGEITEGAFDDIIRHSLTKMSTYHFTSNIEYKKRVVQMGEDPARVLNVGAVGLENIVNLKLLNKEDMKDIPFQEKNFLVTYHPVTAANEDGVSELLEVLSEYSEYGQIITMPNSDPGHEKIFKKLSEYAKDKGNVYLATSLGSLRYLNCMKICDVVIGNSSSGIIEAPFMGTPTLNIGVRQKGRLRAPSVVDCDVSEIKQGLTEVLKNKYVSSDLYGTGESSELIVDFLKENSLEMKRGFYDV